MERVFTVANDSAYRSTRHDPGRECAEKWGFAMDHTALVAPVLTQEMITAGEELLRAVDNAGINVVAALWLLPPDEQSWRLVISSPEIAGKGPHAFYQKIDHILRKLGTNVLSTSLVSALPPSHPLLSLLRHFKTGPGISTTRFTQNVINGVLIPDALIYRLT